MTKASYNQTLEDKLFEHEGFRDSPYKDTGGTTTIGFGYTKYSLDGKDGRPHWSEYWNSDGTPTGKKMSKIEAKRIAPLVVQPYIDQANSLITNENLTEEEHNALVNLIYRNGIGNVKRSGVAEKLNSGDVKGAQEIIKTSPHLRRSGGKVLEEGDNGYKGITKRNDSIADSLNVISAQESEIIEDGPEGEELEATEDFDINEHKIDQEFESWDDVDPQEIGEDEIIKVEGKVWKKDPDMDIYRRYDLETNDFDATESGDEQSQWVDDLKIEKERKKEIEKQGKIKETSSILNEVKVSGGDAPSRLESVPLQEIPIPEREEVILETVPVPDFKGQGDPVIPEKKEPEKPKYNDYKSSSEYLKAIRKYYKELEDKDIKSIEGEGADKKKKRKITSSAQKKLDKAVSEGTISQEEADNLKGTGLFKTVNNRDVKKLLTKKQKEADKIDMTKVKGSTTYEDPNKKTEQQKIDDAVNAPPRILTQEEIKENIKKSPAVEKLEKPEPNQSNIGAPILKLIKDISKKIKKLANDNTIPFSDKQVQMQALQSQLDNTGYTGDLNTDGKPEGQGTYINPNGDIEKGEFKNGELVNGRITYSNGSQAEGEFENGILKKGKYTYEGYTEEGEFDEDFNLTKGKLTDIDGSIYEGEFKGGLPNGGIYTAADGTVTENYYVGDNAPIQVDVDKYNSNKKALKNSKYKSNEEWDAAVIKAEKRLEKEKNNRVLLGGNRDDEGYFPGYSAEQVERAEKELAKAKEGKNKFTEANDYNNQFTSDDPDTEDVWEGVEGSEEHIKWQEKQQSIIAEQERIEALSVQEEARTTTLTTEEQDILDNYSIDGTVGEGKAEIKDANGKTVAYLEGNKLLGKNPITGKMLEIGSYKENEDGTYTFVEGKDYNTVMNNPLVSKKDKAVLNTFKKAAEDNPQFAKDIINTTAGNETNMSGGDIRTSATTFSEATDVEEEVQYQEVMGPNGELITIPVGENVTEADIEQELQAEATGEKVYESWDDAYNDPDLDKSQIIVIGENTYKWKVNEGGDENSTTDGRYMIVDENGEFVPDENNEAQLIAQEPVIEATTTPSQTVLIGNERGEYSKNLSGEWVHTDPTTGTTTIISDPATLETLEGTIVQPVVEAEEAEVIEAGPEATSDFKQKSKKILATMGELGEGVITGASALLEAVGGPGAIVSYLMGKESLKDAMKEITPKQKANLSASFMEHLRQTKELQKRGFHPTEARAVQKEIDTAYQVGLEKSIRGTAGDRAKYLAQSGILDAKRSSALLEYSVKDAELQRTNQTKYTAMLNFKENFDMQRTEALRAEDMANQKAKQEAASKFTGQMFKNVMSGLGGNKIGSFFQQNTAALTSMFDTIKKISNNQE